MITLDLATGPPKRLQADPGTLVVPPTSSILGCQEPAESSKKKTKTKAVKEKAPKEVRDSDTLNWPKGPPMNEFLKCLSARGPASSLQKPWSGLVVSGGKDKMVKKIVRGNFRFAGENHGRPAATSKPCAMQTIISDPAGPTTRRMRSSMT